jgi:CheY-like chemotaxis protein
VLNLVRRMLETLGYRVETAISAVAARKILERDTPIDLVLSDVMLAGGESGIDFAMEMRRARPDLRMVLMSGYPEEIGRNDRLAELGTFLLTKPFRRDALARALRAALD